MKEQNKTPKTKKTAAVTIGSRECIKCPHAGYAGFKEQVTEAINCVRSILYPEIFKACTDPEKGGNRLKRAEELLPDVLSRIASNKGDPREQARELLEALPEIRATLETDIQAAFEGDPAASCREEIMLAYPAFEAISIYRIAHKLYTMKVPILPRMMTEYAHRISGIDIHPGATIGEYFFIDHGTGVVIGETTTIGRRVKLYQGVTLGAKSFEVAEDGTLVKGIKRHPDIGNNVVIYSGATILGGTTKIGDNCVIGGNVWLTHSVEQGMTVLAAHEQALHIKAV
mgnify:FL=1